MHFIASLVYSTAFLLAFGVWIYQTGDYNRYHVTVVQDKVFVFDKRTGILNQCNDKSCQYVQAGTKSNEPAAPTFAAAAPLPPLISMPHHETPKSNSSLSTKSADAVDFASSAKAAPVHVKAPQAQSHAAPALAETAPKTATSQPARS